MRTTKLIVGFMLLGAGIAMLALPGPGWLAIGAGLTMLAGEFVWAQRLLDRIKQPLSRVRRHSRQ
jgi:uncharacterized protein (TIGR02611 family)